MNHQDREKNRSYTVTKQLLPRHYSIQDLHLQGQNYREIAESLSMSLRQVANVINTPQFQHELGIRRSHIQDTVDESIIRTADEVQETLKKATIDAAKRLTTLINSENEVVARQAANDILDRGGFPKVTRSDTTTRQSITLDSEAAKHIETVLAEISDDKSPKQEESPT
jgi:adenylosuccinate synthase